MYNLSQLVLVAWPRLNFRQIHKTLLLHTTSCNVLHIPYGMWCYSHSPSASKTPQVSSLMSFKKHPLAYKNLHGVSRVERVSKCFDLFAFRKGLQNSRNNIVLSPLPGSDWIKLDQTLSNYTVICNRFYFHICNIFCSCW